MQTLEGMLKPLILRTSVLEVRKAPSSMSALESKFGGTPYYEMGETWPVCPTCHKPLAFICQLDLRDTILENLGFALFTFFYCWTCSPWGFQSDPEGQWVVRTYRKPLESKAVEVLPSEKIEHETTPCRVSFSESLSLPDWEGTTRWCPDASDLACQLNEESPWQEYQHAAEAITGEHKICSVVGGYPRWIQGEQTPDEAVLLAQIDSEVEAGIMWGDVGSVYLFVSTSAPTRFYLILQCC